MAIEERDLNLNADTLQAKTKLDSNPSIIVKDISKQRRSENQSRVSQQLQIIRTAVNHAKRPRQALGREAKRAKKTLATFPRNIRGDSSISSVESREDGLESKLNEFIEYTRQRDEENRLIMLRILQAVEKIANTFDK